MKYGLRSENKFSCSRRKWKISMENDIATLKTEVSTLKQQLKSSLDIINLLLSKASTETSVKGCREHNTSIVEDESNSMEDESNNSETNDSECIGITIEIPLNIQIENCEGLSTKAYSEQFLLPSPRITARYRPTLYRDFDDYVYKSISCITAMPEYRDWCAEELRLAFYKAAYPKQYQLFPDDGLTGVLTGTGFVKYSPYWDFDPIKRKYVRLQCITTKTSCQNKSLEELRLEDYILKGISEEKSKQSVPDDVVFTVGQQNPTQRMSVESNPAENGTSSQRQEKLLNQIISHLGKMDTNVSSVNSQLSTMDGNLSEISSQMSVMDSRLSAVDMFVTMQRVDKKWQGLTSRLQALENTPDNSESASDKQVKEVSSFPIQELKLLCKQIEQYTMFISQERFSFANNTKSLASEQESSAETECAIKDCCDAPQEIMLTGTKNTISNSPNNPVTSLADESAEIQLTDSLNLNSNVKVNLEKNKREENNLIDDHTSRSSVDENPMLQDIEVYSSLNSNGEINVNKMESNASQPTIKALVSPKRDSEPLSDTMTLANYGGDSSDTENEFVIIDSDFDEPCGQRSREAVCTSKGVNPDCKIYSSITEYLELKLGKKEDSVYEFGFEAKPDCSIDTMFDSSASSPNQDESKTSPNVRSAKDDSFMLYMSSLIESRSVEQQQSTPLYSSGQTPTNTIEKLKSNRDTVLSYKRSLLRKSNVLKTCL